MGRPFKVIDQLIRTLGSTDSAVRAGAADHLARIGEPAVEALLEAVRHPNLGVSSWTVLSGAAQALGRIGDRRAVDPLIERLTYPQVTVRCETAEALGAIGDARAVGPLIAMLGDPDRIVHHSAAAALGEIRDPSTVDMLVSALDDPRLCEGALTALEHWGALPPTAEQAKLEYRERPERHQPRPCRPQWRP